MSDQVLELAGVTKRYGDFTAVKDVSFVAPRGKIVGLLGPNGAGKTSTLRMILGITSPTQGTIRIFGAPPGRAVQGRIGLDMGKLIHPAIDAVIGPDQRTVLLAFETALVFVVDHLFAGSRYIQGNESPMGTIHKVPARA